MHSARIRDKDNGDLLVRDQTSEPVVACYLFQETDLPAKFQGEFPIVTIRTLDSSGKAIAKPALRVIFAHDQSIEEPVGLLGFGSDLRCHVLLPPGVVSPVHCRVFAQLNSGPQVWIVDDTSTQGTGIQDDDTSRDNSSKVVLGRRQAARGLRSLTLGPYKFQIRPPTSDAEIRRRDDWFNINKAIPVTRSMLTRQLGGVQWNWLRMERVGIGGNGEVYKYMEKNTALYIAVKEQEISDNYRRAMILKEIEFMKTLRHPHLVDILFDNYENNPLPKICTAMPLYLGDLTSMLPLPDMPTNEQIMLQIAQGLHFMHSNQILHRDLKPDNILVASPRSIKIADYGWATSLKDSGSLYGVCGTIAYCAPESLWTNEVHTPAIDVYSLGAIFYAILDTDKFKNGWVRRHFRGRPEWFNTTFENASKSPPRLFTGLVQSMLARKPKGRCSLDESIEVVKAHNHAWTKETPLEPIGTATNLAAGHFGTQQTANPTILRQTPFGRNGFKAKMLKPTPIAQWKKPEMRQNLQQFPIRHDFNNWQPAWEKQEPAVPAPPALLMQKPRSKPTHSQGINFNAGLPSYEEAISQNPFAPLAFQGGKKKKTSHRDTNASYIHPAFRTKQPPVEQAPAPKAHNKPGQMNQRAEAPQVARATLLASTHRRQPRNTRQLVPRSHNRALNLHRARDARILRQADRQEARDRRKAKLKEGLCEATRGTWKIVSALIGFACDGLVVGGERFYDRFKNNRAAREALEHVVANVNVNADARLVASVQRQATRAGRQQSSFKACTNTDAELLDRQLMMSRRR